MKISTEAFRESREEYHGYCLKCDDITEWGGVEPDAEKYPCPQCHCKTVMGVENALLMGHLRFKD